MKLFLLLSLVCLISCSGKRKVIIYKQWHLEPKSNTLDILGSLKLPQAKNQVAIYQSIEKEILKGGKFNFLAEGCEGDTKLAFSEKYNGWNLNSLKKRIHFSNYDQILAPIGMKLLAKYEDRINVYCSDHDASVEKHLLTYSDIKGFLSFYLKFKKLNPNSSEYKSYLESLKKLTKNSSINDPIDFVKAKMLSKLKEFEELLYLRNKYFISRVKELTGTSFIVIGGLHANDLNEKLTQLEIETYLYTPAGYNSSDDKLISSLKDIIEYDQDIFADSVPFNFDLRKFPLKNFIDKSELMTAEEEIELRKILKKDNKLFRYILSDYDKDGIRDFTVSKSNKIVLISAEDPDWDNDGLVNLVDKTVGKTIVSSIKKVKIKKPFYKGLQEKEFLSFLKRKKINLVSLDESEHLAGVLQELLNVLNVLNLKEYKLKNIVAKNPLFTYGKEVFFSYNKSTSSLEYYPKSLLAHIEKKRKKDFPKLNNQQLYRHYIQRILIHSIAHELVHSRDFSDQIDVFANNWSFVNESVNSKYLVAHRLKVKKLESVKRDLLFKSKSYKYWLLKHKDYIRTTNKLIARGDKFLELAKTTPWYTHTKSKSPMLQLSFLNTHNIPSVYSMHSPDEWVAETIAMCIYRKIYQIIDTAEFAASYEVWVGFNPVAVSKKFCSTISI